LRGNLKACPGGGTQIDEALRRFWRSLLNCS
jgi:hypothetical protein